MTVYTLLLCPIYFVHAVIINDFVSGVTALVMFPTFLLSLFILLTDTAIQLTHRGESYPNNSELFIGDIGEFSTGSAILCTTNRSPCCSADSIGEWYYPNGSMVPDNDAGEDFYRSRGKNQTIQLNRRNNARSPGGSFCCELPVNNDDDNHRLCVRVGKEVIIFKLTVNEAIIL